MVLSRFLSLIQNWVNGKYNPRHYFDGIQSQRHKIVFTLFSYCTFSHWISRWRSFRAQVKSGKIEPHLIEQVKNLGFDPFFRVNQSVEKSATELNPSVLPQEVTAVDAIDRDEEEDDKDEDDRDEEDDENDEEEIQFMLDEE